VTGTARRKRGRISRAAAGWAPRCLRRRWPARGRNGSTMSSTAFGCCARRPAGACPLTSCSPARAAWHCPTRRGRASTCSPRRPPRCLPALTCWPGDLIEAVAPVVRRRLRDEVKARVLGPYRDSDEWWWLGLRKKDLNNCGPRGSSPTCCSRRCSIPGRRTSSVPPNARSRRWTAISTPSRMTAAATRGSATGSGRAAACSSAWRHWLRPAATTTASSRSGRSAPSPGTPWSLTLPVSGMSTLPTGPQSPAPPPRTCCTTSAVGSATRRWSGTPGRCAATGRH
jgi:hypothetical protein